MQCPAKISEQGSAGWEITEKSDQFIYGIIRMVKQINQKVNRYHSSLKSRKRRVRDSLRQKQKYFSRSCTICAHKAPFQSWSLSQDHHILHEEHMKGLEVKPIRRLTYYWWAVSWWNCAVAWLDRRLYCRFRLPVCFQQAVTFKASLILCRISGKARSAESLFDSSLLKPQNARL